MHSQVRIREASRDALPTTIAHPLKFRGYDTPIHAVESFIWASYHSDAEALVAMCIAYDVIRHPGPNNEDICIDAPSPNYTDPNNFKLPNGQTYHLTPEGWKFNFPAGPVAHFVDNIVLPKAPNS